MYGFKHVQFIEHPAEVHQRMDPEGVYLGVSLAVLISFTTYYAITLFLELCRSIVSINLLMLRPKATSFAPFSGFLSSTRIRKASQPTRGPEVPPQVSPLQMQEVSIGGNASNVDCSSDTGPHSNSEGTKGDYLSRDSSSIIPPPVHEDTTVGVQENEVTLADDSLSATEARKEFNSLAIEVDMNGLQSRVTTPALEASQFPDGRLELASPDASVDDTQPDASSRSPLLLPAQTPLCTIEECDYEDSLQPSAASAACLSELDRDVTSSVEPRREPAIGNSTDVHCHEVTAETSADSGLPHPGTTSVDAPTKLPCGYPESTNSALPPNDSPYCPSEYAASVFGIDPTEGLVHSINNEGSYPIMHSALFVVTADADIDNGNHTSGAETDHDTDWTPVDHDEYDPASSPIDAATTVCGEGVVKEQLSSSDTLVASAMLLEDSDSICATYAPSESRCPSPDALPTEENNAPILLAPPSSPVELSRIPHITLSEATNSQAPTPSPFPESIMTEDDYIGPLPKAPRVRVHTPENPDWAVAPDEPVRRPTTNHRGARGEKGRQHKNKESAVEEKRGPGSRPKEKERRKVVRAPAKTKDVAQGQGGDPRARRRSARLVQAQT
ncbi:hypothetical protein C8Q73DRAFT_840518 [Cubamyces lactineus]|nr:hypothetical protein C8Q73DRAFT_840518 [Cubamyces lactineus]